MASDFWHPASFEELVEQQGVSPVEDWSVLVGGWPEEADFEEFLEAIRSVREE